VLNVICKFQYSFNIIAFLLITDVFIRISTSVNVVNDLVNAVCKFQHNFDAVACLLFTNMLIRISTSVNVVTAVTLVYKKASLLNKT
jgi:hypothetical protein